MQARPFRSKGKQYDIKKNAPPSVGREVEVEVAHLYLEEAIGPVLQRYSHCFSLHVRYIDDGFLIWTGTLAQLRAMQADLAAIDPENLRFTWDFDSKLAVLEIARHNVP